MPKIQTYTTETLLTDNHVFITDDGNNLSSSIKKTPFSLVKTFLGNLFLRNDKVVGDDINSSTTFNSGTNTLTINSKLPLYISGINYTTDSFVVYNNNLYKCITAHTSGETFDDTKWEIESQGTISSVAWNDVTDKPFNTLGSDLSVTENVLSVAKVNGHTIETNVPTNAVFTDTTYSVFTDVTNGLVPYPTTSTGKFLKDDGTWAIAQGEKGDNAYIHIKYSAIQPTQDSDMNDTPNEWLGIYSGTSATAPITYTSYSWYKTKGENGGIEINDTSTDSTTETWSVNKINLTKQDKITISSTLTLTVAGWNSETKVQKALISLNTSNVNSIIYDLSCLDTVISNAVIPSLEETDGITFKCTTIPTSDITFKIEVAVI